MATCCGSSSSSSSSSRTCSSLIGSCCGSSCSASSSSSSSSSCSSSSSYHCSWHFSSSTSRRSWSCSASAKPTVAAVLGSILLGQSFPEAQGRPIERYAYADPSMFGGIWQEDANLERELDSEACDCEAPPEAEWGRFRRDLDRNLRADPAFSGAWVHVLCREAYGTIFRYAGPQPMDGTSLRGTKCAAGPAAMAIVCARSSLLRFQETSKWRWFSGVVKEEGSGVGDLMGDISLAECLGACEARLNCNSVALGPYGCHLKDRCCTGEDELHPDSGNGYQTYYLADCQGESPDDDVDEEEAKTLLEEVVFLFDLSLQLVEKCVHCFDGAGWSFSISELLTNRIRLTEVVLGAGEEQGGALAELRSLQWSRQGLQRVAGGASPGDGAPYRALARATLRWARKQNSEIGFWHILLNPSKVDAEGKKFERNEEDARTARLWADTGYVKWSWEEDEEMCSLVARSRSSSASPQILGAPRILNTGSGPLSPAPLNCGEPLGTVRVVAADGLARLYLRLYDVLALQPQNLPAQCPVEELRSCFPRDHFDISHMRNALDHTMDPLEGIRQMLEVTRPGGWVLLRHARNEGSAGMFQVGLHQWSFDATQIEGELHFYIWNPALRVDVTSWLRKTGIAAVIRTELRSHPGKIDTEEDPEYIFVDIQKPR